MKTKWSLVVSALTLSAFTVFADVYDDIAAAIRSGNASQVSAYFSSSIDLTILNEENVYSKAQAEVILRNFFSKNTPKGFTVIHKGKSQEGSMYAIGNLETSGGTYRTYFFIKQSAGKSFIQELRFEKE